MSDSVGGTVIDADIVVTWGVTALRENDAAVSDLEFDGVEQVAPVHGAAHTQAQLPTSPDTAVDRPLQSAEVHNLEQFGYAGLPP